MTKSQEQRMNELANKYAHNKGVRYCIADERDFKEGYQSAMKEAEALVEALEELVELVDEIKNGYIVDGFTTQVGHHALKKFKGE